MTKAAHYENGQPSLALAVRPLTIDRWEHLDSCSARAGHAEAAGACGGASPPRSLTVRRAEENRRAMKRIVESGEVPGLLGYHDGEPVGWCSVAPREVYPRLERSRVLKRVDDQPVWSVVCFFVAKAYRRHGVMRKLLEAATGYVRDRGSTILEGYPTEPKSECAPDLFLYHGIPSVFATAGFVEVAHRSERRPIMRYAFQR